MRDNQYTIDGRIRFSEVDHTRRITLPGIVNYFQDCSTFQSEDLGLGIEHCSEKKQPGGRPTLDKSADLCKM